MSDANATVIDSAVSGAVANQTPQSATPSMHERVARAIFSSYFHPDEPVDVIAAKWEEWLDDRARAFRLARAAMRALREPTGAMLAVGERAANEKRTKWVGSDTHVSLDGMRFFVEAAHTAMIDAALLIDRAPDSNAQTAKGGETKMLVDADWLRTSVERDPDEDAEVYGGAGK